MPHRIRATLAAALLSLLTTAPAIAQGFPATLPANTVYGRLGVSQGPGQALSMAQLRTALGFLPGAGTVTSVGCGNGLSGGTITGSGSCQVIFGTTSNTVAQGNDPRITGALQQSNNLSDVSSPAVARTSLGLGTMAAQSAGAVAITGGTITGLPACAGSTDACPKSYIDLLALGFRTVPEVRLASAAVLPNTPTYANGTAGVGATLTAGANAALTVDGTAVSSGDAILVKDQVSTTGCTVANAGCQNGIYTVTTVGDGSNAWVLTRRTDFDTAAEMLTGSIVLATAGSANSGKTYNLQSTVTTVGTTPATFNLLFINGAQWSASGSDTFRSSGNVGIGAAPSTWDSAFKVLQIGNVAYTAVSSNIADVVANLRWDGSHYKYIASDFGGIFATGNGFAWYTAPSGTAGADATITQRMGLSQAGTLRLNAYGAGISTFDSSGNFASKPGYLQSTVYAADSGVLGDGSTNNNTTLQAAIDVCATFPATGKGCILQLPCGQINVTAGFTISHGIIVQGCGPGTKDVPSPATPDIGGTTIYQTCTTCDTFLSTTIDAVQYRDLGVSAPQNATTGVIFHSRPVAVPVSNPSYQFSVSNVRVSGGATVIKCELCGNFTIRDSFIQSFTVHGIWLIASTSLPDAGGLSISNTTVVGLAGTTTGDCVLVQTQSQVRIVNGALGYGCHAGIRLKPDQGQFSGTFQVIGGSIEEVIEAHIRITQASAGKNYGNISILGVEMSNLDTASFQGSIIFDAGAAQYLNYINISHNIISNGLNSGSPAGNAACMSIADGRRITIQGNTCSMGGIAGWSGIFVGGNATDWQALDNDITGLGSGQAPYTFSTSGIFRDNISGLTVATLPTVGVLPGSMAVVTSATPGSIPCTVGGSGTLAVRVAGQWNCH